MLQNILETETEYSKDLQSLLTNYLRPLQNIDKYDPRPEPAYFSVISLSLVPLTFLGVSLNRLCFGLLLQTEQLRRGSDSGKPRGDQHLPADARPIVGGVHQVSASLHTHTHTQPTAAAPHTVS